MSLKPTADHHDIVEAFRRLELRRRRDGKTATGSEVSGVWRHDVPPTVEIAAAIRVVAGDAQRLEKTGQGKKGKIGERQQPDPQFESRCCNASALFTGHI